MLILDTETTGLINNRLLPLKKQPEIIEFYGCEIDPVTGEVSRELELLIKPELPVSEEITRITHITNEMVEQAPRFSAVAEQIKSFIESSTVVCAHNLAFDMDMIEVEFERLGQKIKWPARLLCTVEATMHLRGMRLSLTSLHDLLFKKPFPEAHRARNDVMALARCAVELTKMGEL